MIRKTLDSARELWVNLDRDIYVGDRYSSNMKALFLVSLVTGLLGFILTVVNFASGNMPMTIAAIVTFIAGVSCAISSFILKKRKPATIISTGFCIIVITIYVLTAAGSGSALMWTLLVPVGISYFINVKYGILLSVYYTLLITVLFYSPLREIYTAYYDHAFIVRFPMLYGCFSIFSCIAMIQYHRSVLFEIDHTHVLTEEIEKKTAEAEDLMEVMDIYLAAAISDTDSISGIMNRRSGEMVISHAMQQAPGCFIFFDVDNLKKINDYHGHEAGDRILHIMGDTLKANSEDHLCCRLGGDEFLMFVKNVSEEGAVEKVEKVISDFNFNKKDDPEVAIASLSAGMVMCNTDEDYDDVYNKADKALYYVKQNGKSGYDFYNSAYDSIGSIHVDIEKLLDGIKTSGSYSGAMSVDYRQFTKLYEYIAHLEHRFSYSFKMIVITLETPTGENPGSEELEQSMFCMEQSIRKMIREVDVLTRYSNCQFLVMLLGVSGNGIRIVVNRIFDGYYQMKENIVFEPSYVVADPKSIRTDSATD